MRWFKHYTDSLDDPFIQALLDEFSHVGYMSYFGLIEIIGKEYGKDFTRQKFYFSPTYLRRKLRTSQAKLRLIFDFCQTSAKLSVNFSEKEWEFEFPKIVEIKDNYTKDLQGAGKKPSNHKEEEKEEEGDKDKYSLTSNEVRLSELLLSLIRERNENHREPNIQTWAKSIDLMHRVDKRTFEDIEKVIRWCQSDTFWQNNILSTSKLREKYDQLKLKMKEKPTGKRPPVDLDQKDYTEGVF